MSGLYFDCPVCRASEGCLRDECPVCGLLGWICWDATTGRDYVRVEQVVVKFAEILQELRRRA